MKLKADSRLRAGPSARGSSFRLQVAVGLHDLRDIGSAILWWSFYELEINFKFIEVQAAGFSKARSVPLSASRVKP
jgi:hypothetical protein